MLKHYILFLFTITYLPVLSKAQHTPGKTNNQLPLIERVEPQPLLAQAIRLNRQPVQIKKSAAWCISALRQCWKMKQANIRPTERTAAEAAYNSAEKVYEQIMQKRD